MHNGPEVAITGEGLITMMLDVATHKIAEHGEHVIDAFHRAGTQLVNRQIRVTRAAEHFRPFSSRHKEHVGQELPQPETVEGRITSVSVTHGFVIVDIPNPRLIADDSHVRTWRADIIDLTTEPPTALVSIELE